jgi:Core-2/I-Branching enzyme
MLDNATFFSDLELNIGRTSKLTPENARHLVAYIDLSSYQMLAHPDFQSNFQRETTITKDWSADTLKRGVCWNVAQGNLQWWKPYVNFNQDLNGKHGGRVIRTIDSEAALHFLNFEGKQTPEDIANIQSKHHYRIAYVVMVHWNTDNVAVLLDAISDPTVFIYLHVDLSAPESYHQEIRDIVKGRPNVALMPTSFAVTWSHVSIVWVEMRAFFDLLDLISFDYVVNLSGSDYPLKSADTIFRHLERRPGSNWMWWMDAIHGQMEWRILSMFHCRGQWETKCVFGDLEYGARSFDGYQQLFPKIWKTSQWIILHRSSVEYLRSSEAGKLLLMHSEHTNIPDEYFFPTLFAATPLVERTYRDPKRLMVWTGELHPYEWKVEDAGVIKAWAKHFLWIRKVDLSTHPELKILLDDIRREDKMSNQMVVKYNEGRGVIPVD